MTVDDTSLSLAKKVLEYDNLNPLVAAHIFLPNHGKIDGLRETTNLIKKHPTLLKNGGSVYTIKDHSLYEAYETVLYIESHIQDLFDIETAILGIINTKTTLRNDKEDINLEKIQQSATKIQEAIGKRQLYYIGMSLWSHERHNEIVQAISQGTNSNNWELVHIAPCLFNIYAWRYSQEKAISEATQVFHRAIEQSMSHIVSVDYYNREIDDTAAVCDILKNSLTAIWLRTCDFNVMQGAYYGGHNRKNDWWGQKGVSISGIREIVRLLLGKFRANQLSNLPQLIISQDKIEMIQAIIEDENGHDSQIFDGIAINKLFKTRDAQLEIVSVGDDLTNMKHVPRIGYEFLRPNFRRLKKIT